MTTAHLMARTSPSHGRRRAGRMFGATCRDNSDGREILQECPISEIQDLRGGKAVGRQGRACRKHVASSRSSRALPGHPASAHCFCFARAYSAEPGIGHGTIKVGPFRVEREGQIQGRAHAFHACRPEGRRYSWRPHGCRSERILSTVATMSRSPNRPFSTPSRTCWLPDSMPRPSQVKPARANLARTSSCTVSTRA